MRQVVMAALALVSAAAFVGHVQAQDFDPMQFADTDKDGKVTPAEYEAFTAQGWDFISQGSDKVKLADVDPQFKAALNGDATDAEGFVTKAAHMAATPGRFKAADKNGDGFLDAAEIGATMKPPG